MVKLWLDSCLFLRSCSASSSISKLTGSLSAPLPTSLPLLKGLEELSSLSKYHPSPEHLLFTPASGVSLSTLFAHIWAKCLSIGVLGFQLQSEFHEAVGGGLSTSSTAVALVPGKAFGTRVKYLQSAWITEKLCVYRYICVWAQRWG